MISLHLILKSMLRRKVVTSLLLVQLALTLALLSNSSLLALQTWNQLSQPTGLDLDNILYVSLKPTSKNLQEYPAFADLLERQLAAVRQMPGVAAVSFTNQSPLMEGGSNGNVNDENNRENNTQSVPQYTVSPDFLKVLQLDVLEGEIPQKIEAWDGESTVPVVLTKSLAERVFPGKSAIGQLTNGGPVAAVIEDFYGQRNAERVMYNRLQIAQIYGVAWGYGIILRVEPGQAQHIRSQIPDVLKTADSNIEIFSVRTMDEQLHRMFRNEFGLATLLAVLSGLMLLVSMISSYSNAHFNALKRQQEIGIKRALGASKHSILLEMLTENWCTTAAGAGVGIVAAWLLNQALALVISIPALPVWLPLSALLMLMCCVTLATWYPATIATRVSPATATKTL
ncbi:FtsX-like permease family protein [Rheinheimera texasensis]|uniref:FtsX-like permease family protein n=1 Tax=Rheinheimera texasensis TaxID=306205 RepID=UPI000AFC77EC|nr:FtsX-like permease family protein [Rheinheimera texasensis]